MAKNSINFGQHEETSRIALQYYMHQDTWNYVVESLIVNMLSTSRKHDVRKVSNNKQCNINFIKHHLHNASLQWIAKETKQAV